MTVPRKAWLDALAAALDAEAIVVAGLGANARDLPHLSIRAAHFALCDAMGAAIPLALGMALARADRQVVVLEGNEALLMNLGALATVGATAPKNLAILLFDSRPTVELDLVAIARAARLPVSEQVAEAGALAPALARARDAGPAFYLLPTRRDPDEPIPPYSERPDEIRANFARRLAT